MAIIHRRSYTYLANCDVFDQVQNLWYLPLVVCSFGWVSQTLLTGYYSLVLTSKWQQNVAIQSGDIGIETSRGQSTWLHTRPESVRIMQSTSEQIQSVIARQRHLRDAPNRAHCAGSMSRILCLIDGPEFLIPNRVSTSYYSWFSSLFAGPAKWYSNYGKL